MSYGTIRGRKQKLISKFDGAPGKKEMKLSETVEKINSLNEDYFICARKPWEANSECKIVEPEPSFAVPKSVIGEGFSYFLEIHVAKEVLSALSGRQASLKEKIDLLIFYAENDAYPEWL